MLKVDQDDWMIAMLNTNTKDFSKIPNMKKLVQWHKSEKKLATILHYTI